MGVRGRNFCPFLKVGSVSVLTTVEAERRRGKRRTKVSGWHHLTHGAHQSSGFSSEWVLTFCKIDHGFIETLFKKCYNAVGHWGKLSRLNHFFREFNILLRFGGAVRTPTWLRLGEFAFNDHSVFAAQYDFWKKFQ